MSITIKKYVDITSGVGAGNVIRERELIGRIFTTSPRVPVDGVVEFTSAADVRAYFGVSSEEAARADLYFGFVSKNIVAARKLSFARYADVASAPRIYGARTSTTLDVFQGVTAGTLSLTAGANTASLTGLNFTSATSFADVASTLQTAIRAATGAQFPTALVAYDALTNSFNFTGTVAEGAPISVVPAGLALQLGWGPTAVFSPGADVVTPVEAFETSAAATNNFGSFVFQSDLSDADVVAVATANQARNVEFLYSVGVNDTNLTSLSAALIGIAGVGITYMPTAGQYDDMIPVTVMAATDYSKRNSVQNYMFQQFPSLSAKVTTTAQSDDLDADRVNYYGNTQTAGQQINFYQRGVMGGGATAPVDMNVYANEVWFKDAAAAQIMSLLLSVARVPANRAGVATIIAILQGVIDRALFNGTISVGKTLTVLQKLYITQTTGDDLAWQQVQTIGFWINCVMESYTTTDGRVEYKAVYTLIYSKDDTVRKVEGTHILI